ncbi:MAG: CPBP family intramembrane metalloprotease [Planctomycetia bacterium]|nr:CPBP family intramembrane metalloprotease [Planctomycetia bacterium]
MAPRYEGSQPLPHARPQFQRILPILLTSAFFAAVHFEQMPAPLAIFPLSIALGLLYETTGSLVPSFVLHALFNGFNTTLLLGALLANPHPAA